MASTETRRYDFTLAAYGTQILHASGRRFVVKSSTGAVKINTNTGDSLQGIEAGQGLAMADGQQFSRLEITDMTGAANAGFIIISDDSFIDGRVTGEVSVIDGEKSRSIAGGRFMAGPQAGNGVNMPAAQLFNPAGSDKRLVLTGLSFSADKACMIFATGYPVALSTNLGASYSGSAYLGGSAPVGQTRRDVFAAWPIWGRPIIFSHINNVGGLPPPMTLSGPVVIPPGESLVICADINAAALAVNFEWFEEPLI